MGLDFFEVIDRRFSVRSFQSAPVENRQLQAILEAANSAPSAGNLQAFEVVVIRDTGRKRQLAKASLDQSFIAEAPLALVFLANPDRNRAKYGSRGAELYSVQDTTIASTYAQLAATATGLGTCWVGAFNEDKVREIVGAPASWRPVAILPLGVPAEVAGVRERRALGDLVHEEQARR
jgi:nitroreductase